MWQSSMLISLLVASLEQIIVAIWVKHDILQGGPITRLEPLMVLIMWHFALFEVSGSQGMEWNEVCLDWGVNSKEWPFSFECNFGGSG